VDALRAKLPISAALGLRLSFGCGVVIVSALFSWPEPAGKGAAEMLGDEAATARADRTMGLSFMLLDDLQ